MRHLGSILKIAWLSGLAAGVAVFGYVRWREYQLTSVPRRSLTVAERAVAHARGTVVGSAPTEIVFFSRYSCPYCRVLWRRLDSLPSVDENYSIRVRHLVHPVDTSAYLAALASECAALQSVFRAFHDAVLSHWGPLTLPELRRLARDVAVGDTRAFDECVLSRERAHAIAEDFRAGHRLDIPGVPALVIGDSLYVGLPSDDELADMLR